MTLALLVPNDYRHDPVLVHLTSSHGDAKRFTCYPPRGDETRSVHALRSFEESGGTVMHINRGDETTNPGRRR